nr:hypothetical protein [Tanacetum cinerariifolium]
MSDASSAVTYTSPVAPPSLDYVPRTEHPPSPDYVPGPKHPPSPIDLPYVPELEYPEYLAPSDDEAPLEDHPLPADASSIVASPDYVVDSDRRRTPMMIRLTILLMEGMVMMSPLIMTMMTVASLLFSRGELSSLAVGTSFGSGNSSLKVGMPCAFYSQQSSPKLNAPSAIKFPE